jgi:hypothetical protein
MVRGRSERAEADSDADFSRRYIFSLIPARISHRPDRVHDRHLLRMADNVDEQPEETGRAEKQRGNGKHVGPVRKHREPFTHANRALQ